MYRKCISIWLLCVTAQTPGITQQVLPYVQPLSGTAPSSTIAAIKHSEAGSEKNANTIPATGLPFGMTQWTPQTSMTEAKCIPPYFYKDTLLSGFRGTHWISGSCMQDYGSVTVMPVTGALKTQGYATEFSHDSEVATPSYYKVHLPGYHCTAEMTATARCAMMQYTMQQDDSLFLLVMPNSDAGKGFIHIDAQRGEIWGYNPVHRIYQGWGKAAGFSGYFFMQFEKAVVRSGTFSGARVFSTDSIGDQKNIGAFAAFAMKKGEQLRMRIGTSFSSLAGARGNLAAEIPTWNFKAVWEDANKRWEQALGQIMVQTHNEKDKRIFYTALYHAMQHPRLFSDADGTYPSFAGNASLKKISKGAYYDDFSMWDIYRAQLPLLEILQPSLVNQFVAAMIVKAQQGNWLPIFPCWNSYTAAMIGDHVTAFIASAWTKGIRGYDIAEAYRFMRKNAFDKAAATDYKNGKGRRALSSYLRYGYIPMEDSVPEAFHKKEQVSRTLEYAYDDYALSVVARSLNKTADHQLLHKRAFNYRHVFDSTVNMVRGRHADGRWYQPFSPDQRQPYITEGTPRQYTFYVPQDIAGLARLMGGTKALENALDSLFAKNEYWHGNEPGHQIPFLYNYTASPWKTQQTVRRILQEEYSDGPGGLSGNDDAGQMSAWYIFAAMGLYPVNPVSGEYILCTPLFDTITWQLPGNKKWQVVCHKKTPDDQYIQQVQWNGKPYNKNYIRYRDIMKGGVLEIYLQASPASWGAGENSRPPGL